jgi:hypothetical protein
LQSGLGGEVCGKFSWAILIFEQEFRHPTILTAEPWLLYHSYSLDTHHGRFLGGQDKDP